MLSARVRYVSASSNFNKAVARKQRRVLHRIGGYAKTILTRSIKSERRGGPSVPGQPPRRHIAPGGGLQYVRFDVSEVKQSVLIGVMRTRPKMPRIYRNYAEYLLSPKPVPKLLNESGPQTRRREYFSTGRVIERLIRVRQFPISAYRPTLDVINRKFVEIIKSEKL